MKAILIVLTLCLVFVSAQIGHKDANGCISSAGYRWCEKESACIRPWELAKLRNISHTPENIHKYCNPTIGGDADAHACIASAGYTWCATEGKCVRPWELAKEKGIESSADSFATYCNRQGADADNHGCVASAGYSWCATEGKCVRPWEIARVKGMENTPEAFQTYCQQSKIGGDADAHACIASAGYTWCATEGKCVRPWELAKEKGIESSVDSFAAYCNAAKVGGQADEHGCIRSAGYTWCAKDKECVRPWELAKAKGMTDAVESVNAYCNVEGADADNHGCIASAGYTWCAAEKACARPWEIMAKKGMMNTPEAFSAYCNGFALF